MATTDPTPTLADTPTETPADTPPATPWFTPEREAFLRTAAAHGTAMGATFVATTPLQVMTTRMQASPKDYSGLRPAWESLRLVGRKPGWGAAGMGAMVHGAFRFGSFEALKEAYRAGTDTTGTVPFSVSVGAAVGAELVACLALSPFEMVRVRMQATTETFPRLTSHGMAKLSSEKVKKSGYPFRPMPMLYARHAVGTAIKLSVFDAVGGANLSTSVEVAGAAFAVGALVAIVTHPFDTLVTLSCLKENTRKSLAEIAKEAGPLGLLTRGLAPRMLTVGVLTAGQWWGYQQAKEYWSLPPTPEEGELLLAKSL